jgi:hypothetical protein
MRTMYNIKYLEKLTTKYFYGKIARNFALGLIKRGGGTGPRKPRQP